VAEGDGFLALVCCGGLCFFEGEFDIDEVPCVLCVVAEDVECVWEVGLEVCEDLALIGFSEFRCFEGCVDDVEVVIFSGGSEAVGVL